MSVAADIVPRMASSKRRRNAPAPSVRMGPSPDDAHDIVYFKRHVEDDPAQAEPGRDAVKSWPTSVRAKANAILIAVATAPPKRFAGGGYWEAMKRDMSGWFEVRIDGPKRHHYRLFCLLDYEAKGQEKPLLVVVDGRDKPFRTTLNDADYAEVRSMGEEYLSRNPRSVG